MSHSHLVVRHLVRKIEKDQSQPRSARPALPEWLQSLISETSDLFEPFNGVARVGYECFQDCGRWEIHLFLGEHEIIGGASDGSLKGVNFQFDLQQLLDRFDSVDAFHWNAFPNQYACFEDHADLSFVCVSGQIQDHSVRIRICSGPPDQVGPGLREHSDGRVEIV